MFHSNGQKGLWTPLSSFLSFGTLDNTTKIGPEAFVIVKGLFFEMFVSIDFWGPKELIWLPPQ